MNREERRRIFKKFPKYRKAVKTEMKEAMSDLEKTFEKHWKENNTDEENKFDRNESE